MDRQTRGEREETDVTQQSLKGLCEASWGRDYPSSPGYPRGPEPPCSSARPASDHRASVVLGVLGWMMAHRAPCRERVPGSQCPPPSCPSVLPRNARWLEAPTRLGPLRAWVPCHADGEAMRQEGAGVPRAGRVP